MDEDEAYEYLSDVLSYTDPECGEITEYEITTAMKKIPKKVIEEMNELEKEGYIELTFMEGDTRYGGRGSSEKPIIGIDLAKKAAKLLKEYGDYDLLDCYWSVNGYGYEGDSDK
jgi:hypothetical protein